MANLSNINGKFVVEQTTGYVGVGTTDPNFLIEAAGANSEIALNSTSASIYRLRSTSSDSFIITKNGVGDRLVIAGNGDATFAGNVNILTAGYPLIDLGVSGTNYFRFIHDNPNDILKIGKNGAATASSVIINPSGDVGIGTASFGHFTNTKELLIEGDVTNTNSVLQVISYDNLSSLTIYSGAYSTDDPAIIYQNDLRFGSTNDVGLGGYSEKMRITNGGNVGIGTTSPKTSLDIVKDADIWHLMVGGATKKLLVGGQAVSGDVVLQAGAASTPNNAAVTTAYNLCLQRDGGNVGIGTGSPTANYPLTLRSKVGDYTKILDWGTDVGGSWGTMQISMTAPYATELRSGAWNFAQGNVGIGITNPDAPIHIAAADTNTNALIQKWSYNPAAINQYNLHLKTTVTTGVVRYNFSMVNSNTAYDNVLVLDRGNVGIGTAFPQALLDVSKNNNTIYDPTDDLGQRAGTATIHITNQDTATNTFGQIMYDTDSSGQAVARIVFLDRGAASSGIAFVTENSETKAERMRIESTGNLLFGLDDETSQPTAKNFFVADQQSGASMTIGGHSGTHTAVRFRHNGATTPGSIVITTNTTTYNTSSDYRLKEDLKDFAGLDMVSKIPVYDFKWKTDESRSYGVMAHELQEVLPDAVSGEKDAEEMQGVDYSKIVPLLVKSIQELKADNDSLKARIETLENK